jgi:hypothetical protein
MFKQVSGPAVVGAVAVAAFMLGRAVPAGDRALAAQPPAEKKPAADPRPGGPPVMPPMTPEQERAMTPGPEHKWLEGLVGRWEGEVTFWTEPGAEPMKMRGAAVREMSMDGRFIVEHVKGLPEGENPFRGMGIVGYNRMDSRFESVWLENMSTAIIFATGQYDPARKTMTFASEFTNPMTGVRMKQRDVVDMSNPDRHVMTGYCTPQGGTEYRSFEGVFERVRK